MNDTTKIKANGAKFIAHCGMPRFEMENTIPSFIAAANRSYFGIETDLQKTADGKFVAIHDDDMIRVSGASAVVKDTPLSELRKIIMKPQYNSSPRPDYIVPTLEEYVAICKRYGKWVYLELKAHFSEQDIIEIVSIIENMEYIDKTIFISFHLDNLENLRKNYPDIPAQFIIADPPDWDRILWLLEHYNMDLDAMASALTEQKVKDVLAIGKKCAVWAADDPQLVEKLISWGVSYVTTDTIEGIE